MVASMQHTIGIVSTVQDIKFFTQGYFRTVLAGAGKQISGRDCSMRLVSLTHQEFSTAESARALLAAQKCDAILVVAPHEIFLPTILALCNDMPGVIISPPRLDLSVSFVASDNYGAGRTVIAHLIGRGYRQLHVLQPYPLSGDFWERERGYRDGAASLGADLTVTSIRYPIDEAQVEKIVMHEPQVIIAPSDNDALPILHYLRKRGLRVPDDIALVGFDDEEFAAETDPPLTTVRQPIADLAASATAYLIDRLHGGANRVHQEMLPNTLVVRGSA